MPSNPSRSWSRRSHLTPSWAGSVGDNGWGGSCLGDSFGDGGLLEGSQPSLGDGKVLRVATTYIHSSPSNALGSSHSGPSLQTALRLFFPPTRPPPQPFLSKQKRKGKRYLKHLLFSFCTRLGRGRAGSS